MDCELLAASLQRPSGRCNVVGTATTLFEARGILNNDAPEVGLISPALADGPLAGLDLVREMGESHPETRAIMLLDPMDPRMIVYSFEVGAKGVFSRNGSLEALVKCIDVVRLGQIWAGTHELQIVLEAIARRPHFEPVSAGGKKILTPREGQIASLVADGLRNREISERLKLSAHTVKNYLYRMYDKLGISNRAELAAYVLTCPSKTSPAS
jgi:DNA-binding NarL/FixJ family response regulator